MITPQEADTLIQENVPRLPSEDCPLEQAHGRTLREPVRADREFPPFDRVTMDGYALAQSALAKGLRTFRVIGFQPAGTLPLTARTEEEAVEVATGATLPLGTDTVIPYEEATRTGGAVSFGPEVQVTSGQCVHRRGTDASKGAELVRAGALLTGREIAVAAACGLGRLRVACSPRIAVVATGDELVDIDNPDPAPHQVRRSNDYALRAALTQAGFPRVERFHLRDLKYELETQLKRLMSEFDVIVLTGGVSKGKYDFIPAILEALGVDKKFQGVAQRPGKPFWFGMTPRKMPVFALPGNPYSTFVCLHRYVLPALRTMAGQAGRPLCRVKLATPSKPAPVARFVPASITVADDATATASLVPFNTSGDFTGWIDTQGFVEIPAETAAVAAAFFPWS